MRFSGPGASLDVPLDFLDLRSLRTGKQGAVEVKSSAEVSIELLGSVEVAKEGGER